MFCLTKCCVYLLPLVGHKVLIGGLNDDDALEAALGLGELAGLTVNNEADSLSYDVSTHTYLCSHAFTMLIYVYINIYNHWENSLAFCEISIFCFIFKKTIKKSNADARNIQRVL